MKGAVTVVGNNMDLNETPWSRNDVVSDLSHPIKALVKDQNISIGRLAAIQPALTAVHSRIDDYQIARRRVIHVWNDLVTFFEGRCGRTSRLHLNDIFADSCIFYILNAVFFFHFRHEMRDQSGRMTPIIGRRVR